MSYNFTFGQMQRAAGILGLTTAQLFRMAMRAESQPELVKAVQFISDTAREVEGEPGIYGVSKETLEEARKALKEAIEA